MLRRCMTPNPNSKSKYLSQLVDSTSLPRQQTHRINYDSFFYMDRLTNNKILLGDVKNIYSNKQKRNTFQSQLAQQPRLPKKPGTPNSISIGLGNKNKQYSQSKQMQEINDCFSIMKSTKLFQMQNLKNRIFNKAQDNQNLNNHQQNKENNEIQCMIKKKKKIREFIQNYLNSLCLDQFRKYVQPSMDREKVKLINPNILNIHKNMPNKINKHNIQKIIQQFLLSQNNNKHKKPPINISIDDIYFPDQERLKELLWHRMFIKNKQFQHLVTPSHAKQIYSQIHTNTQQKKHDKKGDKIKDQFCQQINEYHFNQFAQGDIPKLSRPNKQKQKNIDKKMQIKKRQLLLSIQCGSVYDFLFLIIRWPTLLQYKDHLGNNLLHIAAKQNQFQIYSLLIKKLGVQALQQTNNCGKTPVQISKLYGSYQTERINQQYEYCL